MLKTLGRATSTNVQKVIWFCDEEGLAYEHDNDIGGAYGRNDTPEYLAMNPNGRVPVVIDGDFVMWESNSIVRYLARKRKSAFYPTDFRARQVIERWMDWELSLAAPRHRSEEHTSELQSLMRISYAVFCLNKKTKHTTTR